MRCVLRFQLGNVAQEFFLTGQAAEVETNHLISAERRFAAGPQGNQQAGDNGTVGLNLDPVLVVAQQVPASEQVLEEPEECFSVPIILPPKITL
jgi:hypothetical protein